MKAIKRALRSGSCFIDPIEPGVPCEVGGCEEISAMKVFFGMKNLSGFSWYRLIYLCDECWNRILAETRKEAQIERYYQFCKPSHKTTWH